MRTRPHADERMAMTAARLGDNAGTPAHYEVRVDGVLDAAWFEGLDVRNDGRHTIISGLFADQAALHGLLIRIRDLGLCLISLQRRRPNPPAHGNGPDTCQA